MDIPAFASLTECHRPVERYRRALARWVPGEPGASSGAEILGPADAFLMHQLAAFYPEEPTVIDLAADATGGASAALWAGHSAIRRVIIPRGADPPDSSDSPSGPRPNWASEFANILDAMGVGSHAFTLPDLPPQQFLIDWPRHAPADGSPVFLTVAAAPGEDATVIARRLQQSFLARPDATVLVLGLGPVGESAALTAALSFCWPPSAYRLTLGREISPFLASSRLGIVRHADDDRISGPLRRIAQPFDGNFQFLSLAEAVVAGAGRAPDESAPTASRANQGRAGRADPEEYRTLVGRIVAAVREELPAEATVAVISRGDERLLELDGRRAWHFPSTEQGVYAGHHPKDAREAIERLEAQRARGAEFILFPATAAWWLEHYRDFRRHLQDRYRVAICRPETCIAFDLRGSGAPATPRPGRGGDSARAVGQARSGIGRRLIGRLFGGDFEEDRRPTASGNGAPGRVRSAGRQDFERP